MVEVKFGDLKEKDKINLDGVIFSVEKIETSNIGKHGSVKCRLELRNDKGEEKVIIRLADDLIEKI